MLFSKKNKDIIKIILFILIICLLIYILLLNYHKNREGWPRIRDVGNTIADTGRDAGNTLSGGASQGFNQISDYTTSIPGEVTGLVTGLLGDVLNGLQSAVGSLDSKFIEIDNSTNNAVGKSSIFGTNTENAINNRPLISEPTWIRRALKKTKNVFNPPNVFNKPSKFVNLPNVYKPPKIF